MATQNSYQMHLQVNLRHLRLFTLVAETGTTRAAALQAGLTQPAVTQGIARLEEQFNCELFQRSRAGMQINSSGKIIYIRAKRMIELLGEIQRRADTLRRGKTRSSIERTVTTAQLQVVIAVARAHGFSAAARQMDIAEPTVHRTAREFEKLVGVKLFQRVSHGIEMTPAGLTLQNLPIWLCMKLLRRLKKLQNPRVPIEAALVLGHCRLPAPTSYLRQSQTCALRNPILQWRL